jgi:hypothetical protein
MLAFQEEIEEKLHLGPEVWPISNMDAQTLFSTASVICWSATLINTSHRVGN